MPTFAYKCEDCGTKYEIFHKVRETDNEVVCPSCSSNHSKKLMSAPNIGGFSSGDSYVSDMPSCGPGQCSCGLN